MVLDRDGTITIPTLENWIGKSLASWNYNKDKNNM